MQNINKKALEVCISKNVDESSDVSIKRVSLPQRIFELIFGKSKKMTMMFVNSNIKSITLSEESDKKGGD